MNDKFLIQMNLVNFRGQFYDVQVLECFSFCKNFIVICIRKHFYSLLHNQIHLQM